MVVSSAPHRIYPDIVIVVRDNVAHPDNFLKINFRKIIPHRQGFQIGVPLHLSFFIASKAVFVIADKKPLDFLASEHHVQQIFVWGLRWHRLYARILESIAEESSSPFVRLTHIPRNQQNN